MDDDLAIGDLLRIGSKFLALRVGEPDNLATAASIKEPVFGDQA